jgi:hypothetical protein
LHIEAGSQPASAVFPMQVPRSQVSAKAQGLPQVPQLAGSLVKSTQAPAHGDPVSQVGPASGVSGTVQAPRSQGCAGSHAKPQAPQFAVSEVRSTHAPAHAV